MLQDLSLWTIDIYLHSLKLTCILVHITCIECKGVASCYHTEVAWFVYVGVYLSVGHSRELSKNSLSDRGAVSGVDLGGSKEPCIRRGPSSPQRKRQFWGHPMWFGLSSKFFDHLYFTYGYICSEIFISSVTVVIVCGIVTVGASKCMFSVFVKAQIAELDAFQELLNIVTI